MTSKTKIRPIASKPQRILPKEIDNTNVIYILSDQPTSAVKADCDNNIIENSDDPIIEILDGGHEAVLDQHEEHPQQQQIYQIIEQTSEDTEGEDEYTKTITIVSEDQGAGEDIVYVTSEETVVRDAEGQVAFVQVTFSTMTPSDVKKHNMLLDWRS